MKEIFLINIPILKFFNTVLLLIFFDKIIRYKDFFLYITFQKKISVVLGLWPDIDLYQLLS